MSRNFLRPSLRLAKAAAVVTLASAPFVVFSMPALAGSGESAPRYEWWLRALHVTTAWRSAEGGGVTVALLSDGVTPGQPYLAHSVITGPDFTNSGRGPHSRYYGVMGTSLASLIIGHGRVGSKAVDGVAPAASLLSIRVTLSPGDPHWSDSRIVSKLPDAIAAGIKYAVKHGATVIDLPSDPGVPYPSISSGSSAAAGGSQAEQAAVQYAERKGVLLVAPAGDNGGGANSVNYPAAYSGVIAVGAFGPGFVKSSFSSRQHYVTLTAAGENVVAAGPSGFRTLNSTTAASAIAAGIAAIVRSEFPNLTTGQVRTSMTESTVYGRKGGAASGSGSGTIDAYRAVTAAATMSPPHARPAMQGAVRRNRPVAPMVRSSASIIARDLTGDAGVSLVALILLLIPITLYGTLARRRERAQLLLAAERSHHAMSRPGHGTMLADPLLEFFGPQHARPAHPESSRAIPTPRFQRKPDLTGRSALSASLAGRPPALPGPTRDGQGLGPPRRPPNVLPAPSAQLLNGASPSGREAGIVSPGSTVRRVQVHGSPPWEPAKEPTSELPWVIAPPQGQAKIGGSDTPAIPPPPDSVWDSAPARRSSAPRSLFEAAPAPPPLPAMPQQQALSSGQPGYSQPGISQPSYSEHGYSQPNPSQPGTGGHGAMGPGQPTSWQDLPGLGNARPGPDSDRGPIFRWTPTGSTDQFAAVDEGSDGPGRRGNDRRRG